jgi:integrase
MGTLVDQWMEVSDHDESTQERYADLIRIYLRPTFGATPAAKLDAEVLELFYAGFADAASCARARREPATPADRSRRTPCASSTSSCAGRSASGSGGDTSASTRPRSPAAAFERHEPDPPSAEEAAALL